MPNFVVGELLLNEAEKARVKQIDEWDELFSNAYNELTMRVTHPDQVAKEGSDWWLQMGAALPGLISKVSADLLFGEPPVVVANDEKNEEFIVKYFNDVFVQELYQGAVSQSAEGGVALKVFTENEGLSNKVTPRIQIVSQKSYFPTFQRHTNIREMVDFISIVPKDKETSYLLRENQTKGFVSFEEFIINTNTGEILEVVPGTAITQPTGLPVINSFYLPNFRKLGDVWGRSDYDGVEAIFVALNRSMTRNNHNLQVHGGGKLMGPGGKKGILDQHGKPFNKAQLEYLPINRTAMGEKAAEYKYLQPELSVDEELETIKMLLKFAFLLTDISPDVFGLGEGQVDSGKALLLRLLRTLTMVRRKARQWRIGLKWAIDLSLFILGIKPNYTITLQDGLPTFIDEVIDRQLQMIAGGVQSQVEAIMVIFNLPRDEAVIKLAEIQKDSLEKNKAINAGISI